MSNYYLIPTDHGTSQIATANAGTPFTITDFVIGDANGLPYLPESRQDATALLNERARIPVDSITAISPDLVRVIVRIPATVGGFNQHEIGLIDTTGQLVYLGNYPGAYRPVIGEGASGATTLELNIAMSGIANLIIQINPNITYATQDWANSRFVLLSTYNAFVTAEQAARAQGDADAQANAQAYAHGEDVALAAAIQEKLDIISGDLAAHHLDDNNKFGHLQDEIDALGGTVAGLYPKMIAQGNFQMAYTSDYGFDYNTHTEGWHVDILDSTYASPDVILFPDESLGITDFSDRSKYGFMAFAYIEGTVSGSSADTGYTNNFVSNFLTATYFDSADAGTIPLPSPPYKGLILRTGNQSLYSSSGSTFTQQTNKMVVTWAIYKHAP